VRQRELGWIAMSDRHAGDLTGLVERVKRAPVRQVLHGHFGQPLWHVVGGPADRQPARARQEPLPASASLLSVTSSITLTASTPPLVVEQARLGQQPPLPSAGPVHRPRQQRCARSPSDQPLTGEVVHGDR
jgi:hypothetical protein